MIEILTETNKNPRKYEPDAIKAAIMILGLLGEQKAMALIEKALTLPGKPYRAVVCSASADQTLLPRTQAFLKRVRELSVRHGVKCFGGTVQSPR